MADKIDRDRAKDASIKTDDLNLGSIDDISLDFPGEGDEGVEFGKSRKPSNPKKDFAIEFAKGIGGGVKSATAAQLKHALPNGAAIVSELGATFDDIKALKEDLSRQLGPMATTIEGATRKLLPKAEKILPKKFYEKTMRKLDERAAARQGMSSSGPSKEQMEQEQIASELSSLFASQTAVSMEEAKDRKNDAMVDRAMGSVRHRQQVQHLTHLYDSVRATELFHKTQHMAYMKKSLELKYKHIFIARDTFNLLQQSLKTFEGYYKGIMANTALPDMAKVKIGDYHRKNRTERYGNMMSEALSNIRGKIMGKITDSVKNFVSQAGFLTDMVGMGADQVDMMDQMGGMKGMVPNLLGKGVGHLLGGPMAKKLLGKITPITGALNTSLGGMKANAAVYMSELKNKWANADNNIFKNMIADFLPDTFSQSSSASNDLLSKSKEAATFDVITRQSITEIIPGYLGKILHEVTKIQTGDANAEEQVFNVYERRFTGVSTLKADVYDRAFGEKEQREEMLNRTLAVMQAGVARNNPEKDAQNYYKGLEKDINRFCLNHAQYGIIFKPEELRNFMNAPDDQKPTDYIRRVCNGFEKNPKQVIEAICSALYGGTDGSLDTNVKNDIQSAITENYRKMDQYKAELPDVMETYGYRQFFASKDIDGQKEKKLRKLMLGDDKEIAKSAEKYLKDKGGLISSYGNEMNFEEMIRGRADIDMEHIDVDKSYDANRVRRETYDRYRKLDENIAKMHESGQMAHEFLDKRGIKVRGTGKEYDKMFHVADMFADSGKPEEKPGYKSSWSDTARSMGLRLTKEDIKQKVSDVAGSVRKFAEETIDKISPETKKQFEEARKKVTELKKKFEESPTGKKVVAQLEKLEGLYEDAAKKGDATIQWFKDEGAFDDPTAFLKKVYTKGVAKAKGWTEDLPSMSDTEGWKELIEEKTNDLKALAEEKAEELKNSELGKKATEVGGEIKDKATGFFNKAKESAFGKKITETITDARKKVVEKGREAFGLPPKPETPTPTPAQSTVGPTLNAFTDNVVETPVGEGSKEVVDRLDKILGVVTDWHKEAVDNQGTIFDAVAQIDDDLKQIPMFGGKGNAEDIEAALEKADPNYRKYKNRRRFLGKAASAVGAGIKGVGKMYTRVYGAALKGAGEAIKGVGNAASTAIKTGYKAAAGVGKWLTTKEDYVDIYVKGKEGGMPVVSARKQKDPDEGIFYKSSGKRVEHSRDIDEPCVDKRGQLVITEDDLKAGLVMNNSTPIGKIGAGALAMVKGYFSVYGKALTAIGGVVKTVAKGLFGFGVERWQDVYRKDEVGKGPLVTARKQKEEGVYFFESGKKVEKSSDIHEPVCDRDKKILISKEDIEHGLVDVNNKPLGSGGGGGALRALARGIGGALPGIGKFIGKAGSTLMDIYGKGYKGLMDLGFGALKGAGKFLGRALGLDLSGIGKIDEDLKATIIDTNSVLHQMQADLAAIAVKMHAKSVEGTKPQAEAKPAGTTEGGTTAHVDTSSTETKTPGATPAPAASSSDDPFGELKNKIVGGAKEKFSSLRSTLSSKFSGFFGGGLAGAPKAPVETTLPEGDKKIETPEGTEITVEPPLAPATESAIVGTQSILGSIESKLSEFFTKQEDKKNPLDKDGDGDIDGSYADQMQNKKGGDAKRVDARDVHKDVNWLKEEKEGGGGDKDEKGGGLLDALGKLIPKKYRKKFEAYKRLFSSKLTKLAKGIGGKVLGVAKGFGAKALGAGKFLGGKALGLGAKALPWVAKAGGAAMHGLGALGSAAGGLLGSAGSAISGGIASMGGLAGIGSTLAAVAGPAALAALAGYGIYRGVKGFSKKNTLENVGKSEGISKENQLTGEDRMYSALGMNSRFGAKAAKFVSQGLGIHGLIKGIRGNDNPLTDKEIEKGRSKLNNKIKKGLPGYDRILQEYEKAVSAGNWRRARELSGQEADGLIKSMWKNSYAGMAAKGIGNLLFGNKDKEMSKEEIDKARAKFNSIIKKGGSAGKNAEKLLSKFDDYVAEQDWKSARKIAGAEQRGLFGKLFQDSKGNVQWGKVAGLALGGIVGYGVASFFTKADPNKPMSEEEVKKARERLQKLVNSGNKAAQKILDQFDEAVTEQNWKKARKLVGEETMGPLQRMKSVGKFMLKYANPITFLLNTDQDTPLSEAEIKKFTDKMNFLIEKHHDKLAQKKLDKFEEAVAAQKWDKARQIAKMPHKSLISRGIKNTVSFFFGNDDKEMTEQEMSKFRESMQRKIAMGSKTAQKKLDAFEDAVGAQRWRRARTIAGAPDDGVVQKGAKALGKGIANSFRFFFGGDGKPMSETEIEQARKEMGWAISDGKKGAQKRLDLFNDYVADEKWEKARRLAKMPYENAIKRAGKAIGGFLFGNDKEALSPEEIDKFQKECEQRVADGDGKAQQILDKFNSAVESENWKRARAISGMKNKGLFGSVAKGAKKVWNWFAGNSDYEDCQKIREELEEKAMDDETGLIQKGLEDFEKLVRRQKYNDAMDMAKDLLKMKPSELTKKYKLKSEAYEELLKQGQELTAKIDEKINAEKGWFSLNRMRLKSLRGDLVSDQESWSQDFFDDIKERLSSITGEDEFADIDKPDDDTVKKGEKLIKSVEESQGRYSWLGSPIIRTRLANLKSEIQGDMTTWCDATFDEWKKRLKEIDKEYKDIDGEEAVKGTKVEEEIPVEDTEEYKKLAKKIKTLSQREFEARFGAAQPLSEKEQEELAKAREDFQKLKDQGTVKKTKIVGGKAGKEARRSSDLEDYEKGVKPLEDEPEVKEGSPFKAEGKEGNETSLEKQIAADVKAADDKSKSLETKIDSRGVKKTRWVDENGRHEETDYTEAANKDPKLKGLIAKRVDEISRGFEERRASLRANTEEVASKALSKEHADKIRQGSEKELADLAKKEKEMKAEAVQEVIDKYMAEAKDKDAEKGARAFALHDAGISEEDYNKKMARLKELQKNEFEGRFDGSFTEKQANELEELRKLKQQVDKGTSSMKAGVKKSLEEKEKSDNEAYWKNAEETYRKSKEEKKSGGFFGKVKSFFGFGSKTEEEKPIPEEKLDTPNEELQEELSPKEKARKQDDEFERRFAKGGFAKFASGGFANKFAAMRKHAMQRNAEVRAQFGNAEDAATPVEKTPIEKSLDEAAGVTPSEPAEETPEEIARKKELEEKRKIARKKQDEFEARFTGGPVNDEDDDESEDEDDDSVESKIRADVNGAEKKPVENTGFSDEKVDKWGVKHSRKYDDGSSVKSSNADYTGLIAKYPMLQRAVNEIKYNEFLSEDAKADRIMTVCEDFYEKLKLKEDRENVNKLAREEDTEEDRARILAEVTKARKASEERWKNFEDEKAKKYFDEKRKAEEQSTSPTGGDVTSQSEPKKQGFLSRLWGGIKKNAGLIGATALGPMGLLGYGAFKGGQALGRLAKNGLSRLFGKKEEKASEQEPVENKSEGQNLKRIKELEKKEFEGRFTGFGLTDDEAEELENLRSNESTDEKTEEKTEEQPKEQPEQKQDKKPGFFSRLWSGIKKHKALIGAAALGPVGLAGYGMYKGGKAFGGLMKRGWNHFFGKKVQENAKPEVTESKVPQDTEEDPVKIKLNELKELARLKKKYLSGEKLTEAEHNLLSDLGVDFLDDPDEWLNAKKELSSKYWQLKRAKERAKARAEMDEFESRFASGGFATSETPAIDADGNPLVYGEAGTEAIMPIRSKPGNLLSRVGSKVGDILSGKSVGPMDDGASKASVHAGTDESEPMENMMANELAKKVKSRFAGGGFFSSIGNALGIGSGMSSQEAFEKVESLGNWDDKDPLAGVKKTYLAKWYMEGGKIPVFWVQSGQIDNTRGLMTQTLWDAISHDPELLKQFQEKGYRPIEETDTHWDTVSQAIDAGAVSDASTVDIDTDLPYKERMRLLDEMEQDTKSDSSLNETTRSAHLDNILKARREQERLGKARGEFAHGGFAKFAGGGFVKDLSLLQQPSKLVSGAADLVSTGINASTSTPSQTDRLVGAIDGLKSSIVPPSTPPTQIGDDASKKLAEMTEINKQLLSLLKAVLGPEGVKVSGIDALTQVCAMSGSNGGSNGDSGPTQLIQMTADDQLRGIDLRKRQM